MGILIRSIDDLYDAVEYYGFLPFFKTKIKGWSVEEMCDPNVYFTDQDGPWEWKGPLAYEKKVVYGKFIRNKAAFVHPSLFADLSNWRRRGYDWDARVDEGIAPYKDQRLMAFLEDHPMIQSRLAKRECGISEGYDAVLTRLQMQTYIVTTDFQYSVTRDGVPYGWGNGVIDLATRWLGEDIAHLSAPVRPETSFERLVKRLLSVMPDVDEAVLRRELT